VTTLTLSTTSTTAPENTISTQTTVSVIHPPSTLQQQHTMPKFSQYPIPSSPIALRPLTAGTHSSKGLMETYTELESSAHQQPPPQPPSATPRPSKTKPRKSRARTLSNPLTRHLNISQQTLGLSGRPGSRFHFFTTVTADPSNRDSWLESQRRKQKHRTYICWGFWGVFLLLIAGVVVAVVLLKSRGII
jgi:hypothetical protein